MCDGSGVVEEIQIDVDFFEITACPGCPSCDEDLAEELAAAELESAFEAFREALPLWAGMQVYDAQPMPVAREYQRSTRGARGR